jgi:predicted DNA-binding protein with PD1-like motif
MKTHALRLIPGQDLKQVLQDFIAKNQISAGCILTCVGSLNGAVLRMADETIIKKYDGKFEIVSLVGTLCADGCHLHISIADKEGNVFGGHVKEGCNIHTTAEIIIGECEDLIFTREPDESTGFKELLIHTKQPGDK